MKDGFVVRLDVTCFNYVNDSITAVDSPDAACAPFVPSFYSPNMHEEFRIRNSACITEGVFTIYNMWAQPVYVSSELSKAWDGRDNNGNYLPSGTYYYTLNSTAGETVALRGPITVIR
jgi:gliding motility-associated-like protein